MTFSDADKREINSLKRDMVTTVNGVLYNMPPGIVGLIQKGIITGGLTASLIHDKKYNDIDVYLKDADTIAEFIDLVKSKFMDWVEDEKQYGTVQSNQPNKKLITANAITFRNKVQVITLADADHRKTFDYIHCMPWLDMRDYKFYISPAQYKSIKAKTLVKNPNGKEPSEYRKMKYIKRGWV